MQKAWDISHEKNMTLISEFVTRAEALSISSGQSLSTISRKLLNDGKGLARLKEGGQCTLKTMDEALAKLDALEVELSGEAKLRMTHLDRLEAEAIHIMREVAAQCENPVNPALKSVSLASVTSPTVGMLRTNVLSFGIFIMPVSKRARACGSFRFQIGRNLIFGNIFTKKISRFLIFICLRNAPSLRRTAC